MKNKISTTISIIAVAIVGCAFFAYARPSVKLNVERDDSAFPFLQSIRIINADPDKVTIQKVEVNGVFCPNEARGVQGSALPATLATGELLNLSWGSFKYSALAIRVSIETDRGTNEYEFNAGQ